MKEGQKENRIIYTLEGRLDWLIEEKLVLDLQDLMLKLSDFRSVSAYFCICGNI